MEIRVDPALCEANARCVSLAPDVFALDDDEVLHIADLGEGADLVRLRRAVDACPMTALTLVEAPRKVANS
jgi:ferredoxin